jgi:TolA-binding protein
MRTSLTRVLRVTILAAALTACHATPPQVAPVPAAQSEWSATLLQSRDEISAGRYAVAERLLAEFAARYPASPEATEATYWRALYKLDPANPAAAPHDASLLLDSYLAAGPSAHQTEAQVLRRIAAVLEARTLASTATTPVVAEKLRTTDEKAKDEELQRVKDELAKANAELERIRRRLAQPKP